MSFTAAAVMKRANTILQDAGAVYWTGPELRDWLNEAQRAVVMAKPDALAATVTLTLASGTKQTLPAQYSALSRVIRNGGASGRAVKVLAKREILDAQVPGWHNTATMPFNAVVNMVFQDELTPREFYVVPGNTGTGTLEAVCIKNPTEIAGTSLDLDDYSTNVAMPDEYQPILLDFLLFRAFSKDSAAPDAAQRAMAHLELATRQLTAMGAAQQAVSLATQYMRNPG